jgi:hypothetical protein
VAVGSSLPHTAAMTSASPYQVPLETLEATAHVAPEDVATHWDEIEKQDGYMVPNSTSDEIMALAGLLS